MKHEARAWSRTMRTETPMSRPRKTLNASAQAPSSRTVTTPAYMKAIKDAGLELHVWTIDELDDAVEAFKRGAQTVTTNCAKKLLDEYKASQK